MYFIFILEKCDLSALKSISLSTSSESWDRRTYKRLKSLAVLTKSIPSKVFEKTSSHTTDDFELCVADLLGKRASALPGEFDDHEQYSIIDGGSIVLAHFTFPKNTQNNNQRNSIVSIVTLHYTTLHYTALP